MLTLLAGPAAHAEISWAEIAVSPGLHPVRPQLWRDYHRYTEQVMAGPRASPLYRETAAAMVCHWAFVDAGLPPLPFSEADTRRTAELALAGATLGLGQALGDVLQRDPVLWGAWRSVRLVTAPALAVEARPGAPPRVELNQGQTHRAGRRARLGEVAPRGPRPPPRLTLGTGLRLVEREEEPGVQTVHAGLVSSLEAQRLGLDSLHLQLDGVQLRADRWDLAWSAGVRQAVTPISAVHTELRGEGRRPWPDRWRAGVLWHPPHDRAWQVRTGVSQDLGDPSAPLRWEARFQANLRWHLPVSLDRWPLGQRVDARAGPTPQVPDHQPLVPGPVVQTPAARQADPEPQGRSSRSARSTL